MAFYNAGTRILSSDEYYAELIFKWRLALFAIGGFLTGFVVHESLPGEWEKAIRFALIIAAASWHILRGRLKRWQDGRYDWELCL